MTLNEYQNYSNDSVYVESKKENKNRKFKRNIFDKDQCNDFIEKISEVV